MVTLSRTFALLAAGAVALIGAPAAHATFPGKPGKLAFMEGDIGAVAPYGIATANFDGSDQQLIEGPTCQEGEPDPCPANATWSRDGQQLAFDREGVVYLAKPDGTGLTTFTVPDLTGIARPAFSPSGTQIAFQASGADGKRDVYIRTLATGAVKRLTFGGGAEPAWSTDNRIAFTRAGNLYLIKPDGSAKKKLTSKGGVQADWSPNSKRLVFVRAKNVYRVDRNGKNLKKLTPKNGSEPAWRPDGARVLFHANDGAGNRIIYTVKLDGKGRKELTGGEEGRRRNVYSVNQQPLP